MHLQEWVREIHIGYPVLLHLILVDHRVALAVRVEASGELLEVHHILSEGAGLVREYVVDGAQLLIEI